MSSQGKHVHQLTHNHDSDGDPSVDATGKRIAFTSARGGTDQSAFVMDASGSHQHSVTPRAHYEEYPTFARLAG
jgi:Tol biopolymer transport system component